MISNLLYATGAFLGILSVGIVATTGLSEIAFRALKKLGRLPSPKPAIKWTAIGLLSLPLVMMCFPLCDIIYNIYTGGRSFTPESIAFFIMTLSAVYSVTYVSSRTLFHYSTFSSAIALAKSLRSATPSTVPLV